MLLHPANRQQPDIPPAVDSAAKSLDSAPAVANAAASINQTTRSEQHPSIPAGAISPAVLQLVQALLAQQAPPVMPVAPRPAPTLPIPLG